MWLSNDPESPDRSSSPPLEGGESLCEFYADHLEKKEWPLSICSLSDDKLTSSSGVFQSSAPAQDFVSLLNQDLLHSNSFTQTFLQSILSSIDRSEPIVANAWMETVLDVVDLLPNEVIKEEVLALAISKGQLSQPVSSRLLCCKMIGKICMKFDPYVIVKEVLPVVLSLCQDVDFNVRGHMCQQLAVIAKGIGLESTKSAILPELVELANDDAVFVRLAGIEAIVQILPILDDDTCRCIIIPLVKKFCENSLSAKDMTLPVIAKQLGQLCHGFASNFTLDQKQWFLKYFQDLSKLGHPAETSCSPVSSVLHLSENGNRYHECRQACAFNFPAMVVFVGPEHFKKELYTSFKKLCSDPFLRVRQTMAAGFSEVSRLLGEEAGQLLPELVVLLQDPSTEVLKRLIPCLPDSIKLACCKSLKEEAEKELVSALLCCEELTSLTSSWRLHADFLSCLACVPQCVAPETLFSTFVPLLFVKLHTARPLPCRIAAANSLLLFLRSTPGLDRRKGIINEMIRELCHGRSCHKRMLFIRVCELAIELFSKVFFKLHFFRPLLSLAVDPVPNIRLALCTVLPRLKGLLVLPKDGSILQELESCIKKLIAHEKDKDVISAVSKAIQELDKIEIATEADGSCYQKGRCETPSNAQVLENIVRKSKKIPVRKTGNQSNIKISLEGLMADGSKSISKTVSVSNLSRRSKCVSTHTWPRQKQVSSTLHQTPKHVEGEKRSKLPLSVESLRKSLDIESRVSLTKSFEH